jgi:hypothetical protein
MNKTVSISNKNSKMGPIPSVSLPPVITCKHCESCAKDCYALKLCKLRKTVREAYQRNLDILKEDRDNYFLQVKAAAIVTRYFRFHVSGDIIDIDYLDRMVKLARELKGTEFLVFTKNYEDVNAYLESHRQPKNLHLIFSRPFDNSDIENPHNLPTAAVIFKGQEPNENWKQCGGNCSQCACKGTGCWTLKKGETIAFKKH